MANTVESGLGGSFTALVGGQPIVRHITSWRRGTDQANERYLTYDAASNDTLVLPGARSTTVEATYMLDSDAKVTIDAQAVSLTLSNGPNVVYTGTAYTAGVDENSSRMGAAGGSIRFDIHGALA